MEKDRGPLNILQLTLSFENGGRREAIRNLAAGLKTEGHKVYLGCVSHLGSEADQLVHFADHIVFDRKKLLDFNAVSKLATYCQDHNIDLIHTHDAASLFFASLAKWSLKKTPPQIMTFHRSLNFETASLKNKLRNVMSLLVSEGVITVSNARGRDFINSNLIKPKRLQLINLSADIERFRVDDTARERIRKQFDIPDDHLICGAMGHFGLEKGIDVVIKGFAELQRNLGQDSQHVHLLILGRGNEADTARLHKLVSDCQLERVHFAGFQPDPEAYFNAFDIFLHSPREENGATVLFEAMATGLPIVGSDIGGVPEAIIAGETGYIVESETPAEIARVAEKLIRDDQTRINMGEAGLKRCNEHFTHKHYVQRHLDFYRTVLNQG